MKRLYKRILILMVILAAITVFFLVRHYMNRTKYNDTLIYGTTAGNFYNHGLFCEANGFVYFANPADDYSLYRMLPDGSQAMKLSDDSVGFLNADPHYLYYARAGHDANSVFSFLGINSHSLCRIPIDGGDPVILDENPALYVTLIQNDLYYIHYDTKTASTLYKVGIDGADPHRVSQEPLLLSPGLEGTLCYSGESTEHDIHLWNPSTDTGTTIYSGICYLPIDTEDAIYFLDAAGDYHLMEYQKNTGDILDLTECRIDCYNLTEDYLYYQVNQPDLQGLYRRPLDGSGEPELVLQGNFTNINVTSQYVYFRDFVNQDLFYQTPANDPIQVTTIQTTAE